VNALKKLPLRFDGGEWTHSCGLFDPALDPASLALVRGSVIVAVRLAGLIDRPDDLIETPR
jgi:hypothetical protein